jgi:hypothetical protein
MPSDTVTTIFTPARYSLSAANVNVAGTVKANAELAVFDPTYAFASPVLGGQLAVGFLENRFAQYALPADFTEESASGKFIAQLMQECQ